MSASDDSIRSLAMKAGVSPTWRDMAGEERAVSIATLRAILKALGTSSDGDVRDARSAQDAGASLPSARFATARVGELVALPPPGEPGGAVEITCEGGERRVVASIGETDGAPTLPPFERPGYHTAHLASGDFTFAVAPKRCLSFLDINHGRKGWGVAAQTYSLAAGVECGVGDFGGVAALARETARRGADLLAISPVHAVLGVPERFDSPYSPSSRMFMNPVYADPTLILPGSLVRRAQENSGAATASSPALVDWPAARAAKDALIGSLFSLLMQSDSAERGEFERFRVNASPALERYALFEAIRAEMAPSWDWRRWPPGFRSPDAEAAREFARQRPEPIVRAMFKQWLTVRSCAAAQAQAKQAGMSVGLIADVATGIDPAGSDAWSWPGAVLHGLTLGAPPDFFTPAGQDWRLTAFSPQGLAASGFAPFIETLRACLEPVGGLRIDHIMGMQRLWLIPGGAGPKEGAYVKFPAEDLFRLIALESSRRRAIVIGEDLGTLPFDFQDYVRAQGVYGMRLLRIERDAHAWKPPSQWSPQAAALTATHDVIATAGWWKGVDIKQAPDRTQAERQRADDRSALWDAFRKADVAEGEPPAPERAEAAVDAAFAFVAATPCEIKLVTLEDVLATEIQPNVPGTKSERPNWRHRFPAPASELLSRPDVAARLAKLGPPRESR